MLVGEGVGGGGEMVKCTNLVLAHFSLNKVNFENHFPYSIQSGSLSFVEDFEISSSTLNIMSGK